MSYEWTEYCQNPKVKTNLNKRSQKAVPARQRSLSAVLLSQSAHWRAIPKMIYAAILLVFAVPAMAMFTYGRINERLENPVGSNLAKQEEPDTEQTAKQGSDTPPPAIIPVAQPATDNAPVKQSLSMLSESIDWGQVAACVSSKSNCICYGHSAQRLNIVPDTCNAAINYGWLSPKKM